MADDPAARLLALEAKVTKAAAGPYLDAIEEIRALLATEPAKVRKLILSLTSPKMATALSLGLAEAFRMGEGEADEILGDPLEDGEKDNPKRPRPKRDNRRADRAKRKTLPISKSTLVDAAELSGSSAAALKMARALLAAGGDPAAAAAPLLGDSLKIRRTITTTVNGARNDAITAASISAGVPMTIEAERDACVICLRHQGEVTLTGVFPKGLTYGTPREGTPQTCPFHPFCRCRLVPVNDESYPKALRREADRSILRGYALPTESTPERLRAATKLADSGVDAPKSVVAFARKAVKAGKFPPRG